MKISATLLPLAAKVRLWVGSRFLFDIDVTECGRLLVHVEKISKKKKGSIYFTYRYHVMRDTELHLVVQKKTRTERAVRNMEVFFFVWGVGGATSHLLMKCNRDELKRTTFWYRPVPCCRCVFDNNLSFSVCLGCNGITCMNGDGLRRCVCHREPKNCTSAGPLLAS